MTTPVFVADSHTDESGTHTDEWYAARATGIGASEAAAACGADEYTTPLELFHRKRGNLPDKGETHHMKWGKRLEDVIISAFSEDYDVPIIERPVAMCRHPDMPWMLATPDAIADHEGETDAAVEAKSCTWQMARKLAEESDEISLSWRCQVQQQMAVFGLQIAYIAVLQDARHLQPYVIERDDDQIEAIAKAEQELWERIQNNDPPPANYAGDLQTLKATTTVQAGKVVDMPADIRALWDRKQKQSRIARKLENSNKILDARIWEWLEDADIAHVDDKTEVQRIWIPGGPVSFTRDGYWKLQKRKRTNDKK